MSFKNKDMSVIAYANGFTLWHYRSVDTMQQIEKNYFPKGFVDLTANGDLMIVNAGDKTCIKRLEITDDGNQLELKNLN